MNTNEIAARLVELCRANKNLDAVDELYDDDVVSKEAETMQIAPTKGKAAVKAKSEQWYQSVAEIHSYEISDPIVAGSFFAVSMNYDVTFKERGRIKIAEIALYEVKDGKIISDQFIYNM